MRMLTALRLGLGLLALSGPGLAAEAPYALDGLSLPAAHVQVTMKPGYAYAMADLFPLREQLKGDPARLSRVAQALADGPVLERFPKATAVKLALVELPEKDDYGSPLWSSVKVLARFQGERDGAGFKLGPESPKAKPKAKPKAVAKPKPKPKP